MFGGEPSSLPGESTAKEPPSGVPNPPVRLDWFFPPFFFPLASDDVARVVVVVVSVFNGGNPPISTARVASSKSPTSASQSLHAGAFTSITSLSAASASARVIPLSLKDSSDTYMSPRRLPPRNPPHENTSGPTPATACRHRRDAAAHAALLPLLSPDAVTNDHPALGPADVFNTASEDASSTMLPPPSAPPDTCSRVPMNATLC
mmetsp:Transcript_4335/g.15288  ORF Transcript_4335/g.15288 Transcript_4335/m.15288 type:complete len:205 (-) Transcript_4335:15-629(-)